MEETGVCLDGHKQGCPHLTPDDHETNDKLDNTELSPTADSDFLEERSFHTGEKLTLAEASRLLNERPSQVVLCAGGRDVGKTTFIARIGEMFRDGSFSNYRFAGSISLCAFERATWKATVNSEAATPDTDRTERRENDTFLHLRIQPKNYNNDHLDVLISDLAGETFPEAVASGEFCANLGALVRADHLVVFLDCARLMDNTKRHAECDNVRQFLHRVRSIERGGRILNVQVVFSRWDYVITDPQRTTHEKFCESIQDEFIKKFAKSFGAFDFHRIAARPRKGRPTNCDIQLIFERWRETPSYPPATLAIRNRQSARDFSSFGLI